MSKHIAVDDEVWKRLSILKITYKYKSTSRLLQDMLEWSEAIFKIAEKTQMNAKEVAEEMLNMYIDFLQGKYKRVLRGVL